MTWPTPLDSRGEAPTLIQLLAVPDLEVARQAAYLAQAAARLKEGGHQPEGLQIPLVADGVRCAVPLALADRHGNKAVVFTQAEEWTPERVAVLRAWIEDIRKAGIPVPVLVVSQHESAEVAQMAEVTQFIPLRLKLPGDRASAENGGSAGERTEPIRPSPATAPQMAAEAVAFVREKSGVQLSYIPDSLKDVDAVLEKLKASGASEENAAGLLFAIGCYVGEVFVRNAGGVWRTTEEKGMSQVCSFPITVELPNGSGCNAIGKVFKRFRNGPGDSVAFFYHATLDRLQRG